MRNSTRAAEPEVPSRVDGWEEVRASLMNWEGSGKPLYVAGEKVDRITFLTKEQKEIFEKLNMDKLISSM